jgi:hypothetical protein
LLPGVPNHERGHLLRRCIGAYGLAGGNAEFALRAACIV